MKRLFLVLIVVVALAVATVSPALATTLVLPSGDTVEVPADAAANAGNSGEVGTGDVFPILAFLQIAYRCK